jgi:hypothetical protein
MMENNLSPVLQHRDTGDPFPQRLPHIIRRVISQIETHLQNAFPQIFVSNGVSTALKQFPFTLALIKFIARSSAL